MAGSPIPDPVPGRTRVLVVGAGLMGAGIAQTAAMAGYDVEVVDQSASFLTTAQSRVRDSLDRFARRPEYGGDAPHAVADRIVWSTDLERAAGISDLVIEAISEDLEAKQSLFQDLADWTADTVLLATNTSQFPIGKVAATCQAPERVAGMHWSNPPPMMPLVEVIRADASEPSAVTAAQAFVRTCGKEVVTCEKDVPGFIANRFSGALFTEAMRLVDEGVADPADIDAVARLVLGHRMGPIETLDFVGLDTALRGFTTMNAYYGGGRFYPPPVLAELVSQGHFGRKTGSGFYQE
ncbi:3-hydroxyacyl-CoA dehydrogenase family protein [Qaidamihabitans albus]|uniref:3-hydroxyacyl-CoA dehydrogenase family protein n=1 Tax=Qaidamihabitans albus TaxID=2795733 RepID=UPI0018F232C4|nr:3-hydroxyacyl-CoA dehydrogenase family protein [Qaidamihabitans albus]